MKQLTGRQLKLFSSLKQKKYRDKEGKFLIEGWHLLEECVNSDFQIEMLIIRDDVLKKYNNKLTLYKRKKDIKFFTLGESSFKHLADTQNSQGLVCVVRKKDFSLPGITANCTPVIALDEINDPGNLGTILRTSYWFDAGLVLIGGNSADVYNPKVIRASQGALFHVEIKTVDNLSEELISLKNRDFSIYLLTPASHVNLEKTELLRNSCFVFGNEARGISKDLCIAGFSEIGIEGHSNCESLNLAVSAGIVMHQYRVRYPK